MDAERRTFIKGMFATAVTMMLPETTVETFSHLQMPRFVKPKPVSVEQTTWKTVSVSHAEFTEKVVRPMMQQLAENMQQHIADGIMKAHEQYERENLHKERH